MGEILSVAYGVLKALPILDSWFKALVAFYVNAQIKEHKKDFAESIVALIKDKDQTILERAIGSSNAGKPSVDRTDVEEIPAGEFER